MKDELDRLPWETDEDIDGTSNQTIDIPHEGPEIAEEPISDHPIDNSLEMWLAMEAYHNIGLSVMWGRAADDPVKKKKAKSPLISTWSSEIESRLSLDALSRMMHKEGAHIPIAPIIICGKGSGNLIVLDIDEKHMPGISARFLLAFRETYPELYEKVRRHWTPTKGRHLLWRTEEHIEFTSKNPPLAFAKGSKRAGIESRTHGGYVLAPPGLGYMVDHDVPIPTISVADHEKIFALARLFNEEIPVKAPPKQKTYEAIYNENANPFQDFNASPAAEYVLRDNGWDFDYENTQFVHYTRPGKDRGVSASYHKEKRFFHFFTSSTEIDTSKWNGNYSPANVRCILQYNGDWKKFYRDLVHEGYGKHKAGYEKKVIQKHRESGKPLPANFSEDAREELKRVILEKSERYPFGTFWEFNVSTEKYMIQRMRLDNFMDKLGLRLYKGEPCIIEGQVIRKLKESKRRNGERDVFKILKDWIREEDEEITLKINHEFSKFWQASGEFTITTLPPLDEKMILRSSMSKVYKFFLNGILEISKAGYELVGYEERSENIIWADSIIQREFHYVDKEQQKKSMYVDFLNKALVSESEYVQLCVGYLGCDFKGPDDGYFILLQEPRDTSKGGGSGKGYFCRALDPWTSVLVTNAEAVKKDIDQLIQNWNGEKVVHLSDLPKWVNLSSLKNLITDDSQRKLLYKDIQNVKAEDMPKFVGSTQFGIDTISDGGVSGRVRELAFSDYFGRNYRRIKDEYGGQVPDVWDSHGRKECRDWDGYFSYMTDAVTLYLATGKIDVVVNQGLWRKGFDARFSNGDSYFREALIDQIPQWKSSDKVTVKMVGQWYDEVCKDNNIPNQLKLKMEKVHCAIREYGLMTNWYNYKHGEAMGVKRETVDGISQRVVKIIFSEKEDGWDSINDPTPF